ncbi:MAG: right-handed parallel beta-helix repeat-containing protein [Deltaproteobacteria bacterium]|nr:right-handed parallel beta-helix repeat-containing protein [Deltaproteobacteria bacterium]
MRSYHLLFAFILSMLVGLVSPAAAATIIVTTNQDTVDLPFDASSPCGTGTIGDLPGADGQVSLREAIIATNNTPGVKTIQFASSLSGATIGLNKALYLCGGHTTVNGDVNGDDTPDVTVDGSAIPLASHVIDIVSDHNTVKNLQVQAFRTPDGFYDVISIAISAMPGVSLNVKDNTIAHNIVTGGAILVSAGLDPSNLQNIHDAATNKRTTVVENTISGGPTEGIIFGSVGDHHAVTGLTIARNTFSGNTFAAIIGVGGVFNRFDPTDDGASDNSLDVTIKDNTITNNSNPGGTAGIGIIGGFFFSSHNQVTARILHNRILNNNGNGILVESAQENSSNNDVVATIRGNTVEDNNGVGILAFGAIGAAALSGGDSSGNSLDARIEQNTVSSTFPFLYGIWVAGGIASFDGALNKVANANEVNAVVSKNTVTGTTFLLEGIHLEAGGSGAASDNAVEVSVEKNAVCGSAAGDIHALGGLLGNPFLVNNSGLGNTLEGEISKNTATTIVVEDGVAGNLANVTQFHNAPCP